MKNKIKPPQQTMPLGREVLVLREIDRRRIEPTIMNIVGNADIDPGVKEYEMPWWDEGFVSNDTARHFLVSDALIKATKGFAVARTDNGQILKRFTIEQLAQADAAVAGARVQLAIEVDLDDAGEDAPAVAPEVVENLDDED